MIRLYPDAAAGLVWCLSGRALPRYELRSGDLQFASLILNKAVTGAEVCTAEGSWWVLSTGFLHPKIELRSRVENDRSARLAIRRDKGELRIAYGKTLEVRMEQEAGYGCCRILNQDRIQLVQLKAHRDSPTVDVNVSTLAWERSDLALLLSAGLFLLLLNRREMQSSRRFWSGLLRKIAS